jgi:hypothetical protein
LMINAKQAKCRQRKSIRKLEWRLCMLANIDLRQGCNQQSMECICEWEKENRYETEMHMVIARWELSKVELINETRIDGIEWQQHYGNLAQQLHKLWLRIMIFRLFRTTLTYNLSREISSVTSFSLPTHRENHPFRSYWRVARMPNYQNVILCP